MLGNLPTKFAYEKLMMISWQSFGEDIYKLEIYRDMQECNSMIIKSILDEVTIHLDVLGLFMADVIL